LKFLLLLLLLLVLLLALLPAPPPLAAGAGAAGAAGAAGSTMIFSTSARTSTSPPCAYRTKCDHPSPKKGGYACVWHLGGGAPTLPNQLINNNQPTKTIKTSTTTTTITTTKTTKTTNKTNKAANKATKTANNLNNQLPNQSTWITSHTARAI
jgi:hypothetical protein